MEKYPSEYLHDLTDWLDELEDRIEAYKPDVMRALARTGVHRWAVGEMFFRYVYARREVEDLRQKNRELVAELRDLVEFNRRHGNPVTSDAARAIASANADEAMRGAGEAIIRLRERIARQNSPLTDVLRSLDAIGKLRVDGMAEMFGPTGRPGMTVADVSNLLSTPAGREALAEQTRKVEQDLRERSGQ